MNQVVVKALMLRKFRDAPTAAAAAAVAAAALQSRLEIKKNKRTIREIQAMESNQEQSIFDLPEMRQFVCRSVGQSVGRSVGPSVS